MLPALLAPLRLAALAVHIAAGLAIAALAFPWMPQPRRNPIIRLWSRWLVAVCGARLTVAGVPLDSQLARTGVAEWSTGRLLLLNHVSWIDVFALLAVLPSRFVAKSEIGRWPVLGALVTLVGTIYIERGRRHAVAAINHRVREHLKQGETIAVFPEGTTTDGSQLLPFHSNLIAPAVEVGSEVWPVAIAYTNSGKRSTAAAFVGEMGLITSLWNIVRARNLTIDVALLPPIVLGDERNRHHIAHMAQQAIAAHLGLTPPPAHARARPAQQDTVPRPTAPAPDTAGTAPESARDPASASR